MRKLAGLVVLLAMTSSAYAGGGGGGGGLLCQIELLLGLVSSCPSGGSGGCGGSGGSGPAAAPEVDPGSAMTALTLVLGALAVARGRRSQSR
jgi:hypothetical protein